MNFKGVKEQRPTHSSKILAVLLASNFEVQSENFPVYDIQYIIFGHHETVRRYLERNIST